MRLSIDMLGVKNEQKEDDYSFMCSKLSEILVSERELKSQQSIVQNVTPEPHQPDEFKIRLQALQEGIAALQSHIEDSEKPHQDAAQRNRDGALNRDLFLSYRSSSLKVEIPRKFREQRLIPPMRTETSCR